MKPEWANDELRTARLALRHPDTSDLEAVLRIHQTPEAVARNPSDAIEGQGGGAATRPDLCRTMVATVLRPHWDRSPVADPLAGRLELPDRLEGASRQRSRRYRLIVVGVRPKRLDGDTLTASPRVHRLGQTHVFGLDPIIEVWLEVDVAAQSS